MAKAPRSTESLPVEAPPTTTLPDDSPSPVSSTNNAMSSRARWVLASIAGVGVLSVGLLGGILIGQQIPPAGAHTPPVVVMGQSGPGHIQKIPPELRERIKDRFADQRTQRRDERSNRGEMLPSPSAPSPDDIEPNDSGQ